MYIILTVDYSRFLVRNRPNWIWYILEDSCSFHESINLMRRGTSYRVYSDFSKEAFRRISSAQANVYVKTNFQIFININCI